MARRRRRRPAEPLQAGAFICKWRPTDGADGSGAQSGACGAGGRRQRGEAGRCQQRWRQSPEMPTRNCNIIVGTDRIESSTSYRAAMAGLASGGGR